MPNVQPPELTKEQKKELPDWYCRLPKSYVDCLLLHKEGHVRVGRLNFYRNCWCLSSYQECKSQYIWQFQDVVKWEVLRFHRGESHGCSTRSDTT